ncbi:DUF2115 domain-containing protein [Methanoplanus endosymbiosus]|uniref:UPF0305 protein L6E24_04095 n=1 Tax=Methanoplanus endosymbiosus TaxID=33865 RepID=A0A9E7TL41_9EURY|nr:DUF2115 domain-containing protein [Methanoplanus endosymbiosus]UUX93315.1 DUF2115 domain-containing protein [Methanoplanus endosymbiosus]
MKASELLTHIRSELIKISDYTSEIENKALSFREEKTDVSAYLREYNYSAFKDICDLNGISPDFDIDPFRVESFTKAFVKYLDTYAPGDSELKIYTLNVSLYLTFIAKKPLHPPEMSKTGLITIIRKGGLFYCSEKSRYVKDSSSLCRYCVCRKLSDESDRM